MRRAKQETNMIRKLAVAAAVMAAAAATPAAADVVNSTGPYVNLGGTWFSTDNNSVDVTGVTGRFGYRFTPNFGVEGEASFGIDGDTADFLGTPVDVDLDDQFGVYAVGFLPITPNFELLGRVGYATIDAEGTFGGFSAGVDDDGLAFGAGAQYAFTRNFGVRGEYTRYVATEDDGVDAWTLAGVWAF
jgi:outer membrane immunogenic protein